MRFELRKFMFYKYDLGKFNVQWMNISLPTSMNSIRPLAKVLWATYPQTY